MTFTHAHPFLIDLDRMTTSLASDLNQMPKHSIRARQAVMLRVLLAAIGKAQMRWPGGVPQADMQMIREQIEVLAQPKATRKAIREGGD